MYHKEAKCALPQRRPFKIECVVVCNNYGDFLRWTLPYNKHHFDRMVVVTSPEDTETQKICEYNHVQCIQTDEMRTKERAFCKGHGINIGLKALSKDVWVLHLDADIALPPLTRRLLEQADLDPSMVYGIDRFDFRGFESWLKFLEKPVLQHENNVYIHTQKFTVGTRIMMPHMNGYMPIGFFQLWNPKVSGIFKYPEGHISAGHEDLQFGNFWPRAKRSFIPEIVGYHLESVDAGHGTNWNGRQSARFELQSKTSVFFKAGQFIRKLKEKIWLR